PRVDEQVRHLGGAAPSGALVDGEGLAHALPRESRNRVRTLTVRHGGTAPVAHGDGDVVDAGWHADELLIDHALVGALRLLKGADADRLICRELAHRPAVRSE